MAKGFPAASEVTIRVTTESRSEEEEVMKEMFSSALWCYPVHKYIGYIVQENHFNVVDCQPEHKWIYFQWYCDRVSQFMEYVCTPKKLAVTVLKALPTWDNLEMDVLSDPDALIAEKDAMYILATYNVECFGYLLSVFAIDLKEKCLDFVEKQLRELAEKTPSETLSEQIKEFTRKQKTNFVDQKIKAVEGIEKLLVNEYLDALRCTSPLSFITSKEIDPEAMPPVSNDPVSWEVHFLWVCGRRLSLALSKEKEQFEEDFSQLCEKLQPTMIGQLERLKDIVNNPGIPTRKHEYPFTAFTKNFREELSDLIGEKLH